MPPPPTRVLVVDDDLSVGHVTVALLNRLGFAAKFLPDAPTALAEITLDPKGWDVLLTDYDMPGMLGTELTVVVREIAPHIWIVLWSGTNRFNQVECARYAIDVMLEKPVSADDLQAALTPRR